MFVLPYNFLEDGIYIYKFKQYLECIKDEAKVCKKAPHDICYQMQQSIDN